MISKIYFHISVQHKLLCSMAVILNVISKYYAPWQSYWMKSQTIMLHGSHTECNHKLLCSMAVILNEITNLYAPWQSYWMKSQTIMFHGSHIEWNHKLLCSMAVILNVRLKWIEYYFLRTIHTAFLTCFGSNGKWFFLSKQIKIRQVHGQMMMPIGGKYFVWAIFGVWIHNVRPTYLNSAIILKSGYWRHSDTEKKK